MRARAFGSPAAQARLRRRRAAESRFRFYARAAVAFALVALTWLLVSIFATGLSAFSQHWVELDIDLSEAVLSQSALPEATAPDNVIPSARDRVAGSLASHLGVAPDNVRGQTREAMLQIVSVSAATSALERLIRDEDNSPRRSIRVPLSDLSDQYLKGRIDPVRPDGHRRITDRQMAWIETLRDAGRVDRRFNMGLLRNPDSRDPVRAGLATALFGSLLILLIASAVALPVGIGAAIYLDGFAPRTGWGGWVTRALEVNLNNLAAVPPIVFGLLGLAIFINLFGLSRSIPLVGGLVLALRMFPTVVIASRAALDAVPVALTDGALSLGASRMQAMFGHKVPVALPGLLTGSIIGMAQALGETAPLLMIGMVAFVTTVPQGPMDPASALPVQIFLWSGSADAVWAERASAAIIVLLGILLVVNGAAVMLRERLQRRKGAT